MSVSANLNNPSLLICFKSIALVLFHLTHGYFGERVGSKGGGLYKNHPFTEILIKRLDNANYDQMSHVVKMNMLCT